MGKKQGWIKSNNSCVGFFYFLLYDIPMFQQQSFHAEYALLVQNDDHRELRKYLSPLIQSALDKQKYDQKTLDQKQQCIYNAIPVAVERYLSNKNNIEKQILFSTYFTWYIGMCIQKDNPLKKGILAKIRSMF